MSFLAPLAFGLLGLTLPLVLLYFLKVRRREQRVPSLLFWEPTLHDRQASAFFQRLQRDPLLLLQILALLALTLALARPAITVMGHGARKVAVVLDASASMKTRDVSGGRFAAARSEAAAVVNGLGEGAEVLVVETGAHPHVLAPLSRDRDRALAAIRSAQPRDLPNRLPEALRTARALVGTDPQAEIYVFTDGAFALPSAPETTDNRVRWISVGRGGRNVGLTNLAVRKGYQGSFEYQAFASLVNYSAETQTFTLKLELDGVLIAEKPLTLEPNIDRKSVV